MPDCDTPACPHPACPASPASPASPAFPASPASPPAPLTPSVSPALPISSESAPSASSALPTSSESAPSASSALPTFSDNPVAEAFQGLAVDGSEMLPYATITLERMPQDNLITRGLAESIVNVMARLTREDLEGLIFFPIEFTQGCLEDLQIALEMNGLQAAVHQDCGLPIPPPFCFQTESWNDADFMNQPGAEEIDNLYRMHEPFIKTAAASIPQHPPSTTSTAAPLEDRLEAGPSLLRARHCRSCICWLVPMEDLEHDLDFGPSDSALMSGSEDKDPMITAQDLTLTARDAVTPSLINPGLILMIDLINLVLQLTSPSASWSAHFVSQEQRVINQDSSQSIKPQINCEKE
ncbi:hypothetical protein H1R20_g867, partial [Candolleomyces eurysporus]